MPTKGESHIISVVVHLLCILKKYYPQLSILTFIIHRCNLIKIWACIHKALYLCLYLLFYHLGDSWLLPSSSDNSQAKRKGWSWLCCFGGCQVLWTTWLTILTVITYFRERYHVGMFKQDLNPKNVIYWLNIKPRVVHWRVKYVFW